MRCIIVGLHAAGRSACEWLRRAAPDAEIIGVDPEPGPPYARPLISYVLGREIDPKAMEVADDSWFTRRGVSVFPERAASLDPNRKLLVLASGRELAYDRLLLACGATPRPVAVAGNAASEVCYFRGRGDLARVLERVKPGGVAAVLGGGLVGFKLAMGLLKRGMRVKLLVTSPRPLALNVDEEVGEWAGQQLGATSGLELRTRAEVRAVDHIPGGGFRLTLADGSFADVDLVAAGKGVVPELGWLTQSGLKAKDGLLVDGLLQTNAPEVYAAGDLAEAMDIVHETPRINAIWPMAVEQGRVAALNMAGVRSPYDGALAMNAIVLFGQQMVSVGAVNPRFTGDAEQVVCQTRRGTYLKLVFREGRLIGAIGLNAAPRLGELAWGIRRRLKPCDIPAAWRRSPENAAPLADKSGFAARNVRL